MNQISSRSCMAQFRYLDEFTGLRVCDRFPIGVSSLQQTDPNFVPRCGFAKKTHVHLNQFWPHHWPARWLWTISSPRARRWRNRPPTWLLPHWWHTPRCPALRQSDIDEKIAWNILEDPQPLGILILGLKHIGPNIFHPTISYFYLSGSKLM